MATSKNGMPVRLSWTMLVRNSEATLEPLLKQLRPYVQELIIGFGGKSTDRTEAIAKKYADVTMNCGEFFPDDGMFDWAGARNKLLHYVTGEFFGWCDSDDELQNPERLPDVLKAMDERGWDRADFLYNYAYDKDGNVLVKQQRERICRTNKQWVWMDRCHEWLHAQLPHQIGYTDFVAVNHRRDVSEKSGALVDAQNRGPGEIASERNLPILLKMYEEEPLSRHAMHIGHAYFGLDRLDEAQYWYEVYLEKPDSDIQQWNINCQAARCCMVRKDFIGMKSFALMAVEIQSRFKDPYILLAHAAWFGGQETQAAQKWLEIAAASDPAPLSTFVVPMEYTINVWDIQHRLYADRSEFEQALEVIELSLKVQPDNIGLLGFKAWYGEALRTQRCRTSAITITDEFVRRGDITRAEMFLNHCLPFPLRDDPVILRAQTQISAYLDHTPQADSYEHVDALYVDQPEKHFVPATTPRVQWYIERLKAYGCQTVLEVGCHIGDVSKTLGEAGFKVTGIDFNPGVIEHAETLNKHENVTYRTAKLADLVGETFDAVLFAEVLEHQRPRSQVEMLTLADDMAPLVLGSVPAEIVGMQEGLYEPGRMGDDLFRPHIFEFDENDLTQLILTDPRRRIINNHKLDDFAKWIPGFGNRVFEYDRERQSGIGITFVLGPGLENWNPHSIETGGIGGSETACVRLAEELAGRGHLVTVFANCEGLYNGVLYRHWTKYDPKTDREIVIYSRLPDWINGDPTLEWHGVPNARVTYLWCHDMRYPPQSFNEETAAKFDGIIVMSEWQKQHWAEVYPWLDMDKVQVIGNAISPYEVDEERQRHRFAFTSSPDRGINNILRMWPHIKEMWPDAEFHSYYGWQSTDVRYKQESLRDARQPGVFIHDRIGQKEVAEEFAKSQFWLYPAMWPDGTDFHETFCITALEAQQYGCIPVTRAVGAVPERIVDPNAFVEPWTTENVLARLKAWDESWGDDHSKEIYDTWKSVGDKWLTLAATHFIDKYGEVEEVNA